MNRRLLWATAAAGAVGLGYFLHRRRNATDESTHSLSAAVVDGTQAPVVDQAAADKKAIEKEASVQATVSKQAAAEKAAAADKAAAVAADEEAADKAAAAAKAAAVAADKEAEDKEAAADKAKAADPCERAAMPTPFENAGAIVLTQSTTQYQHYQDLFTQAQAHVAAVAARSGPADDATEPRVLGTGPSDHCTALVTSLCNDIVEVTDETDEMQLLQILEKIEEIGVLLELNTKLAASVFTKIGNLEDGLHSAVGKHLCQTIGSMGAELSLGSNEHARKTALDIVDEFTRDTHKPTMYLIPADEVAARQHTAAEQCTISPSYHTWEAPAPPASTESIFATAFSRRIIRDAFATPDECRRLAGLSIVAMAGSYHRGGHCSVGASASEMSLALSKLNLDQQVDMVADAELLVDVKQRAMRLMELDHELGAGALCDNGGAMLVRIQGPECAPVLLAGGEDDALQLNDNFFRYWDVHCDKAEIATWDYSALVYLNSAGRDFRGGEFSFVDADADRLVTPTIGRLVSFASGFENMHQVKQVTSGVRIALVLFYSLVRDQFRATTDVVTKSVEE